MKTRSDIQPAVNIEPLILSFRDQKIILDSDLARLHGVETKALNRAVKRNAERFPKDFMFQLNRTEFDHLKCQIGTSSSSHGGRRKLPWAFTEHGTVMAANVLNSPRAVQMSVFVVRAFLKMRALLGGTKELARQLKALEAKLTARLDGHEAAIVDVLQRIMRLLDPPPGPEPPCRQIGFHARPDDEAGSAAKGRKR